MYYKIELKINHKLLETMEKTEEDYEAEFQLINEMFPDAQFTVAIPIKDIDDVISTEPIIVIKLTHRCYCYDYPKVPEWFSISNTSHTNKTILKELIKQNLNIECNHRFIESFHKITDIQFEIATGS